MNVVCGPIAWTALFVFYFERKWGTCLHAYALPPTDSMTMPLTDVLPTAHHYTTPLHTNTFFLSFLTTSDTETKRKRDRERGGVERGRSGRSFGESGREMFNPQGREKKTAK